MLKKRIIAKLEIKGPNLVKGVNLEGLRVLGKPEFFSENYYNNGINELFYQDVVASLYGKNALYETISKTAKKIFIPLIVGGGIRKVSDIYKILRAGADKVSINSQAFKDPNLIYEAVRIFGKSTIVANVELLKKNNKYFCYYNNGRTPANIESTEWIMNLQKLGVGEIIVTFIDYDGTGNGFDVDYIKSLKKKLTIPLVVSGGAGSLIQVTKLFKKTNISGIALGSFLHYNLIQGKKFSKNEFKDEGNVEFITTNNFNFKKFENKSVSNILKKLNKI